MEFFSLDRYSFVSVPPGDAQLVRQCFSGCLRDVSFKMADGPSEEWKPLDWEKATKKVAVYESWEGCPLQTVQGAHFLGHGRILVNDIEMCDDEFWFIYLFHYLCNYIPQQ